MQLYYNLKYIRDKKLRLDKLRSGKLYKMNVKISTMSKLL